MRAGIGVRQDLDHRDAAYHERIGHQRAVTAPRHGLRAHDRNALRTARGDELFERVGKGRSLHVVRKAAKALVTPAGVGGVLPSAAQAAKRRHGQIVDSARGQRIGQGVGVELRVVARARDGADVGEPFDPIGPEQAEKPINRQRRVADREDRATRPVRRFPWTIFVQRSLNPCAARASAASRNYPRRLRREFTHVEYTKSTKEDEVGGPPAHCGMLSCFFRGFSSFLLRSVAKTWERRGASNAA